MPLLDTYVAGSGYCEAGPTASGLAAGDPLVRRRAPHNAYAPRSVEVWTRSGAKLGHIPRLADQALSRLMDAGIAPEARVTTVGGAGRRPEIRLRVSVPLAL